MVENKSVRITCDFCRKVVAVKKFIGFDTVNGYYTIGKEHIESCFSDVSADIHLCRDCYFDMKQSVVDILGKRRRQS